MAGSPATILHADLDAFFASVEQLLEPRLRGRPIAVGGGVVLAASYEAKAFGVGGGMPAWRARRLCPALEFVGGHFEEYRRLGDDVIDVMRDFTPFVERVSIDEAFLDVKGAVHLFGPPATIASAIRRRVRGEVGLPLSVGVATTKHLAKVASQVAKPDGIVVVEPEREREFLAPLPVGLLWGCGPVAQARLASAGITTIGELSSKSPATLTRMLGHAIGEKLGFLAANVDPREVETTRRARSVGAQSAIGRREATEPLLRDVLGHLADRVAGRLRASGRGGRTITVRVRFPGMRSITRATTLAAPISTTLTLTEVGVELARVALADHPDEPEITLLAISVSNLAPQQTLQLELPFGAGADPRRPGSATGASRWAIDRAMDGVRDKFGRDALGYAGTVFRDVDGGVPDAFRELAQSDG
jgi:DNA polymerase-4